MKIDKYGQVTITGQEAFEAIYANQTLNLEQVNLESADDIDQFNRSKTINADFFPELKLLSELDITVEEFDKANQQDWFMPNEYKNINIAEWLLDQCKTGIETERVIQELELFIQHNMIELLKYLKYLVDTMRKNNIVWGVGRGSSVASYVLFLIGVHKIDSIFYELPIEEFLR